MSAKYIFIYCNQSNYYVGLLDENFDFKTFKFSLKSTTLEENSYFKLCNVLDKSKLSSGTSIVIINQEKNSKLTSFLSLMKHYIDFKYSTTTLEQTFNRIVTFHRSFKKKDRRLVQTDYNYLYKMMRAREVCNWISHDVDVDIAQLSNSDAKVQKILRIGLYYMCIKNYFNQKNKKSK